VNLLALEKCFEDGERVDLEALVERRVLKPRHGRLKILGTGDLSKKLTVRAEKFSGSAREKVEKAGGTVEVPVSEKKS
jgi:large subunit ribosomal protein L15